MFFLLTEQKIEFGVFLLKKIFLVYVPDRFYQFLNHILITLLQEPRNKRLLRMWKKNWKRGTELFFDLMDQEV